MGTNIRLWVLVGSLFLAPGAGAKAPVPKPLADLSIREMTSVQVGTAVYRALLGVAEIYHFLVIEKVRLGEDEAEEPALVQSWRLTDMEGGSGFEPTFEGDQINQLHWKGDRLEFAFHGSEGHTAVRGSLEGDLTCIVSGIPKSKPAVVCRPARR